MPKFKGGGGVQWHDSDVDFHLPAIDNIMCNNFVISSFRVMGLSNNERTINIQSISNNNIILSPHRSMEI